MESIARQRMGISDSSSGCIRSDEIGLPGKLLKTRYIYPQAIITFEVDVFHDKNEGLIIAEIELDSGG